MRDPADCQIVGTAIYLGVPLVTRDARIIELKQGQAQFSVAKDPTRPFKVLVGDRTIVALGTVFTVDFTDRKIHVAMVEGRVAVVPPQRVVAAERKASELLYGPVTEVSGGDASFDSLRAGVAAWSIVHGLATLWLNGNLPPQIGDDPEEIARTVASYLFRSPTSPPRA